MHHFVRDITVTVNTSAECLRADCNILGDKIKRKINFMKPEDSLPHSQVPVTCPYPEAARFSPYPYIPLPEDQS